MSAPSMISGRSGLLTASSLKAKAGRRLAKPPSAARSCSRPASGRLSGARELNSLPPTAPRRTASEVERGGERVGGQRRAVLHDGDAADAACSENTNSWPPSSATSFSTATASLVTSGPMPSPAVTRIFRFIPLLLGASGLPLLVRPSCARLRSIQVSATVHTARAFANLVGQQADQVLVVDVLLAVGEGDKAVVGVLQFVAV